MKGPNNINEELMDLKSSDFLESVFIDIARNLFGMAHLNMVNPKDIQGEPTSQNVTSKVTGFRPREAIESKASLNSAAQSLISNSLVPVSKARVEDKLGPKPRDNLINPSPEVSRHSTDFFSFNTEPTSLFDIFLRRGSPFTIFRDPIDFESSKNDINDLFKRFEDHPFPTDDKPTLNSWSSSVSIYTSADGVTTTRRIIRRSDGTEEITETITPPTDVSSKREERSNFGYKPSSICPNNRSGFFGFISEFWHNIFT